MAEVLVTYGDIISSIREKLGVQSTDTLATNKIRRMVNEYYLDEVVPFKNWMWLQKTTQIVHSATYETGTVDVTPLSTTATLSTAPTGLNFTGRSFSVNGSDQIYKVSAHTTSSTTVTISPAFQEDNDNAAAFKIWRGDINLPTEAKETVDVWHINFPKPLDGLGPQKFREKTTLEPKAEGFPLCYNTYDYFDPSTSGDDETESDRYRVVRIHPAINTENCLLNVDYIQEADPLDDLTDEPLMPIGDRVVLFYGALANAYSVINRNEEMHDRYMIKAERKLARMAGNREEGQDVPRLSPSKKYINNIRRARPGRARRTRGW